MSMMRWIVGGLLLGTTLIVATKASAADMGDVHSHLGVMFTVEPERTYWKYTFTYGGESYEVLDFQSRDDAIAGAQRAIEQLKGGA